MTISQLKEDSKFLRLTEKQQTFVLKMCETNGDTVKSAHYAYDCKDDASAKAMAYQQLKKAEIKALVVEFVEIIDKRVTKEELLSKLGDRFRRCEDDELILDYAERISKMEGWDTKPSQSVPEPPKAQSDFEKVSLLEK
jgi:phage terminase small subunit